MKTPKTRHQLFLSEELGKRLDQRAKASGKPRSEILVEALDAWFNRRETGIDLIATRIAELERRQDAVGRKVMLLWEAFARLLRSHLLMMSGLPTPDSAARASAARAFESFIDEMAERMAGNEPDSPGDPVIEKLRRMH